MTSSPSAPSRIMRLIARSASPLWDALLYSSPLPVRLFVSISALLWCILLTFPDHGVLDDPVYRLMFSLVPRSYWAAAFGINGLLLAWRIFDPRPRIAITRVINSCMVWVWLIYIGVLYEALGYFPPDAGDEFTILFAAIWMTLRTNMTVSDRESA